MELSPVPNFAFAGTACFSCYRSPPDVPPLKRCSGCKRVRFCSTECTQKEWADHKSFCRAFSAVRSRTHAVLPPLYLSTNFSLTDEDNEISSRRETQRAQWLLEDELLTVALGREQTLLEGKLLYKEPRCGICWDREADVEAREGEESKKGWRVCGKCRVVAWCCEAHEKLAREEHLEVRGSDGRTQCQTIQLSSEIDEFYLRHSLASPNEPPHLWIPSRLLTSPTSLPESWEHYLTSVTLPSPPPLTAQIYGVFLEALSPVFTILSHLSPDLSTFDSPHLNIHILEPTPSYTGLHLPVYEELLHYLPSVKSFSLSLIGTSVPSSLASAPAKQTTCPSCTSISRARSTQWYSDSYTSTFPTLSPLSRKPNLIIAFQPAMSSDPLLWTSTLKLIVMNGLKAVFTARTEEEAKDDWEFAREVLGEKEGGVWEPRRNDWAGGRPVVDGWEEDGVWRNNAWVWGVEGSVK